MTEEAYITNSFVGGESLKAWKKEHDKQVAETQSRKIKSPKSKVSAKDEKKIPKKMLSLQIVSENHPIVQLVLKHDHQHAKDPLEKEKYFHFFDSFILKKGKFYKLSFEIAKVKQK